MCHKFASDFISHFKWCFIKVCGTITGGVKINGTNQDHLKWWLVHIMYLKDQFRIAAHISRDYATKHIFQKAFHKSFEVFSVDGSCQIIHCSPIVWNNSPPPFFSNFQPYHHLLTKFHSGSPNLNRIKHIWDHMGLFIRNMDSPPTTVARLQEALLQAWAPCTEHGEGRDGHQGWSYPILTRPSKDPINYNDPWKF